MGSRLASTDSITITDRDILKDHWREDKFGELTDEKLALLAENIHAVNLGNLYDTIEHVLDVWEECGIQ